MMEKESKKKNTHIHSQHYYSLLLLIFCDCVILGFIRCAESIPILIGVPLTAFLNDSSHRYGRAGYFICSASTAISAILMFFVGYPKVR